MLKHYLFFILLSTFFERSFAQNGTPEENIAYFSQQIQLNPSVAAFWNSRGLSYSKLSKYEQAISDYNHALELDSGLSKIWTNRGNAYYNLGKYELAISDLNKSIELDPKNSKTWNSRGVVNVKLEKYKEAYYDYSQSLLLDSSLSSTWKNRGIVNELLYKSDSAISDYSSALKFDTKNKEAWNNRGHIYYKLAQYDLAIADFTQVIELDPKFKDIWNNRGNSFYNLGKYDSAILDYSVLLKDNPNDPRVLLSIIISLCNKGQFEQADIFLTQLKNSGQEEYLNKKKPSYLRKYIFALTGFLKESKFSEALPMLLEALKDYQGIEDSKKNRLTDMEYANILVKTGWVYDNLDNKEKAMEYYLKAQTISQPVQNVSDKISVLEKKITEDIAKDTTPPFIQIITPKVTGSQTVEADNTASEQLFVSGTVKDLSGIEWVKVNGANTDVLNNSGYFSLNISNTVNTLVIQASDTKGNITTESLKIEVPVKTTDDFVIPPITKEDNPSFHAVLIACSNYSGDGWNPLPSTVPEAMAMKQVLMNSYGFDSTNILELYNKDYVGILSSLSSKLESMKDNDNLIIYFAGHGTYKQKGTELIGYWVPINTTNINVDYISNKKLDELIAGSKVKHILMLSDACYSGAMRGNDEVKTPGKWEYKLKSRQILTSGGLEKVPGESTFIKMVMQTLLMNEEKYLPVSELYSIIYSAVKKQTETEPKLNDFGKDGNEGGQFFFMKKN